MIEAVFPDLYRLEIPLPNNPLKSLNSYIIKGGERNLMVDTGMNREECITVMQAGLQELDVDLKRTDFFITHLHADHLGLVSELAADTSVVYFNRPDAGIVNDPGHWQDIMKFGQISGFPEEELEDSIEKHPGRRYGPKRNMDFSYVKEGDVIRIGDYAFDCVETPGHTGGHICLYEAGKKILLSGDHILYDITPNISLWSDDGDPLKEYLESLDKIYGFDIEQVLPGHRSLFRNCRERIDELKQHHKVRAEEVLTILKSGSMDAFSVASQMTWDLTYESWDLFPVMQKWFAHGEAIAHLRYLEGKHLVKREIKNQKIEFVLA